MAIVTVGEVREPANGVDGGGGELVRLLGLTQAGMPDEKIYTSSEFSDGGRNHDQSMISTSYSL